jgi:hypothetical protein
MRIVILFLFLMAATAGAAAGAPATRPATTQSTTKPTDADAVDVFTAFLDATAAQDRAKLQKLVLLPPDEKPRATRHRGGCI